MKVNTWTDRDYEMALRKILDAMEKLQQAMLWNIKRDKIEMEDRIDEAIEILKRLNGV